MRVCMLPAMPAPALHTRLSAHGGAMGRTQAGWCCAVRAAGPWQQKSITILRVSICGPTIWQRDRFFAALCSRMHLAASAMHGWSVSTPLPACKPHTRMGMHGLIGCTHGLVGRTAQMQTHACIPRGMRACTRCGVHGMHVHAACRLVSSLPGMHILAWRMHAHVKALSNT